MTKKETVKDSGSVTIWKCLSHKRETSYINRFGERCCPPHLGGILLPCHVVPVSVAAPNLSQPSDLTKIIQLKNEISFDEEKHLYKDKNGNRLISVSQLVHAYAKPFDTDGSIVAKCAAKNGVSVEELKAVWKQINTDANIKGTAVHKSIETFINTGEIKEEDEYAGWAKKFKSIMPKGKLYSEIRLFNENYGIAGTLDMIEDHGDNEVSIHDIKTNKKLQKYSPFKNRMLEPFSYWHDCNFNHYTFQLNLYSEILETLGYWVKNLNLYYCNPQTEEIEIHPIKFIPKETKRIIEEYKKNKDKILASLECKD